jgi:hypothetical protein
MPEVLNRASSAFLDSPVKPGNDINVALLMTVLVSHAYLGYTLVMKEMGGKYMLK